MASLHIKKNDEVVVIAGADRGKRGKVIAVNSKNKRAIVEGVHMLKKHMRKSQQHPQGAVLQREGSLHVSNLMIVADYDGSAKRTGHSRGEG